MKNSERLALCAMATALSCMAWNGEAIAQTPDISIMECVYSYSCIRDTAETRMGEDGELLSGKNSIHRDSLVLQIGTKASRYYSYEEFQRDSLVRQYGSIEEAGLLPLLAGVKYIVYKDKEEGKVYTIEGLDDSALYMEEETPSFGWRLEDGSREILGYDCNKATCSFRGRDYVAWYTSGIAVSDGPWKFSGLPGLIMEVYDIPCNYHYRIAGLKSVSHDIGIPDINYTKLPQKKFYQMKRLYEEDVPTFHSMTSSRPIYYRDSEGNPIDPSVFVHPMKFEFQEILR